MLPRVDSACRLFPEIAGHRSIGATRRNPARHRAGLYALIGSAAAQTKGSPEHIRAVTSAVDGAAIRANARNDARLAEPSASTTPRRASAKLNQINADNVKDLGLVWAYDLESTRGVEATPLVVDGIMYVTASWSVVHAIDARTGKRLWVYDPEGRHARTGYKGCCDVVNRGVALYKGKVFVGAYDGRLVALDAATGKVGVGEGHHHRPRRAPTPSPARRASFKGKVIIGNGGAEYGVRGYVTAYDAETGDQALALVHGARRSRPSPSRTTSMAAAAKTWDPSGKYWEAGGGGTAWDTHDLRSRPQPDVRRHRQRLAVGARASAARRAATTSTSPRSSRSTPTPANTSGTTRKRRATTGTTPRRSR